MPVVEPPEMDSMAMDVDIPHENGISDLKPEDAITRWNFSAPEPESLKGFLNIRTLACQKLKDNDSDKKYAMYEERAISIKNMLQETLGYKEKIMKFIEQKAYLFKTPLDELPCHPNFIRDYASSKNGIATNGYIEGLEVLTEVNAAKKTNLPPRGEFKRRELKAGDAVFVMKTSVLDVFGPGTVLSVREGDLYKVRLDDGKGGSSKLYTAKQLAYREPCDVVIPVGTRIIARYSDGMYAGVTAEVPITTNKERYLVFFDDGYAQYIIHEDVRVICAQSNDVANDMHNEVRLFVHEYLAKYPERAMLKLQVNQRIKTEYDFNWLDTKVLEVDCSMVQLLFLESGRKEMLYRGSTRLKLLFDELASAQASRLAGKHRRHNVLPRKPHQPYVEYTRDVVTIDSDSDNENSSVSAQQQPIQRVNGQKPKNTARKSTNSKPSNPVPGSGGKPRDFRSHLGTRDFENLESYQRNKYKAHECSILCREIRDPGLYKKKNIFCIPLYLGWERQVRKYKKSGLKVLVMYRAPCGRHLRGLKEIQEYLWAVSSNLTIDYFTLETNVMVFRSFKPKEVLYETDDVTQGKERIPISCVNSWANEPPQFVDYEAKRYPGKGVVITEDKEFLIGCSCTDYCQNSATCECQQITNYAHSGRTTGNAGYKFRRLLSPLITGVYECNDRCKCGPRCGNRVVQNGLQVRLQMFKTQRKGWGIRCLDDLEAGMFISIYAGKLNTDSGADEDGRQLGDEYLAELDHIEVNERLKEGYESDVSDIEMDDSKHDDESKSEEPSANSSDSDVNVCDSDSDFDFESTLRNTANTSYTMRSRKKRFKNSESSSTTSTLSMEDSSTNHHSNKQLSIKVLPDITTALDSYLIRPSPLSPQSAALVEQTELKRLPQISENGFNDKSVAKKSSYSLNFSALPTKKKKPFKSLRQFYGENNSLFVMDAKSKGNIGRYLNHSCDPNLFVQSVFTTTHDLRFHEVAFFAQKFILAGTELTWDYSYEIDSVANKTMYCFCDSRYCRGRLL